MNIEINFNVPLILGILQIFLIFLKIGKFITWSWWVVLVPFWVYFGFIIISLLTIIVLLLLKR